MQLQLRVAVEAEGRRFKSRVPQVFRGQFFSEMLQLAAIFVAKDMAENGTLCHICK
jgi:hypothetical protein